MTRIVDLRKKVEKKEILPVVEERRRRNTEDSGPERIEKAPLVNPVRSFARAKSASPKDLGEDTSNRLEWEAPSFFYNPQKKYLALIATALLTGAGVMIFYRMDTLTATFLILSSLVLILYANKKPTISKVVVNQAGVIVDDHAYYYKELKSFWLDYNPTGPKELSLEARKWYVPYVKISIENQNPVEIRSLMTNFVAEKEHEKSLVDLIGKKIGL